MPIYSYRCEKCKKEWTELKRIAERETDTCRCGGVGRQVIQAPDVLFSRPYWQHRTSSVWRKGD